MEFLVKLIDAFKTSSEAFIFLWAILVVGVFSLTVVIERTLYLSKRQGKKSDLFISDVLKSIQRDDIQGAIQLCNTTGQMALAQVVKAGLESASLGAEKIRNAIDESMLKIIPNLEKRTGFLAVIGNVSTLMGLLGTVYGLIMSFAAVGRPGIDAAEKSNLLAAGIATAMNATFSGLTVAITSVMVYAVLKAKTQKIIDDLDEHSLRLVNALMEKTYKTHKYHISTAQLKEGVGVHIMHNNIKIFTDNKLIKEINV